MANQLVHLLNTWFSQRDETDWVLGTIYKTEGSCYRKAGAMMLFGGDGQQYGLLSGGCLESGIRQHAQRVMLNKQSMTISYDASDEEDLAYQLGIGCGGIVHILLQPISAANHYLELPKVYQALQDREAIEYHQLIENTGEAQAYCALENKRTATHAHDADIPYENQSPVGHSCYLIDDQKNASNQQWLINSIQAAPHILVVGGGLDAIPVINIAKELGWETSLWDPRPANARPEHFMAASHVLDCTSHHLIDYALEYKVDGVILMSHNITLDADALTVLYKAKPVHYMALLGPESRRKKVLKTANLSETDLKIPLSGPAGLDIGGELPESIALSIIAECHACLLKKHDANTHSKTEKTDVAA
ncbi:MAG: Xanthine and CO dehydrogenases maturation factor, XdhC/CoxF family [uncultured Thiotrichaceae bacterium]|uniref:Xanthine and CO dehydrogenases maturation factor, XdhC/CoxF family n=1 Tax=uncultured Thiotrichaceae bacterium TaxID=298394 RepID=A0A6S6SQH1_9GAMM|nr:MAG: Xanthine and CO dehydrogenases maturation factor, XdhC/CoxF family [uncultured Thiotrichaceae bacterium]